MLTGEWRDKERESRQMGIKEGRVGMRVKSPDGREPVGRGRVGGACRGRRGWRLRSRPLMLACRDRQ